MLVLGLLAAFVLLGMTAGSFASNLSLDDSTGEVQLASEEDAEAAEEEASAEQACAKAVYEEGMEVVADYKDFLEEYFNLDMPSSTQVDTAMNFYRYVEDMIVQSWSYHSDVRANISFDVAYSEASYCTNMRDALIDQAQVLLQAYVRYSGASKNTFEIVDDLKEMNENLNSFSEKFHETFPAMLEKMNNIMPCYARDCITK